MQPLLAYSRGNTLYLQSLPNIFRNTQTTYDWNRLVIPPVRGSIGWLTRADPESTDPDSVVDPSRAG